MRSAACLTVTTLVSVGEFTGAHIGATFFIAKGRHSVADLDLIQGDSEVDTQFMISYFTRTRKTTHLYTIE